MAGEQVYYDDLPPYYTIRMPDGTERATVRARLETLEERKAADAERRRAEAEVCKPLRTRSPDYAHTHTVPSICRVPRHLKCGRRVHSPLPMSY